MNKLKLVFILFLTMGVFTNLSAYRPLLPEEPTQGGNNTNQSGYRNDCVASTSQTDLNINNVRARLLGGGDMWWDFNDARYVVPNVAPGSGLPEVSSIFAGAIWLGGWELDEFGNPANLKMAAQTYRSNTRNDFWPGPLDASGGTQEAICNRWDKHFTVYDSTIISHLDRFNSGTLDCGEIDRSLRGWPAKGNPYFAAVHGFELPLQDLAPFFDENGDGVYNPCDGDFPIIEMIGCETTGEVSRVAFADQMTWYVFNDNGGIHTRTTADPIRMEVQTMAFAYQTGDEVNDMTFYRYKLINKSAITIDSTFFGQWVDADLGCPQDDFIGADTSRSLMFIYNDGSPDGAGGCGNVPTYGNEVPMLGVDYFRGPKDENGIELGMSSFIYYVRSDLAPNPNMGDPVSGQQFYNYLSGTWRDGTPYYGTGNAYQQSGSDETRFVFSDEPSDPNGWSMCTEGIQGADLRTVQASGPFRLLPGAINELIIGVVWVPDVQYPCPEMNTIRTADNLAQALYDNCFKITDGPDAPDLDIIELNRKLVILLSNDTLSSNNKFLGYEEKDLQAPPGIADSMYKFEGYKVYQLAEPNFSDLDDPAQARLIFQSDLNNGVSKIYNWEEFPGQPAAVPVFTPSLKVDGQDAGLKASFEVTEDQFAEGERQLVNHKSYYFVAVAYAYNNYASYNPTDRTGQRRAYLEGRRNVSITTGIPRIPTPEFGGITLNADYGDGAVITRLDGNGTGLNFLDISDETVAEILNEGSPSPSRITYKPGGGPIAVKVVDPLRVQPGTYTVTLFDDDLNDADLDNDARWVLETPSGEQWFSETTIDVLNEQLLIGKNADGAGVTLGISLTIGQVAQPGEETDVSEANGFIGARANYADATAVEWYQPVPPSPDQAILNYVPTGENEPYQLRDPQEVYKSVLGGAWVPYTLTQCSTADPAGLISPAFETPLCNTIQGINGLDDLINVDIVLTNDKSKWSRVAVVEAARQQNILAGFQTIDGRTNMQLRTSQSLDKDGNPAPQGSGTSNDPNAPNYIREKGMSWFPGYAIDVETGKRLNLFFAENTIYRPDEPIMSNFANQLELTGGDMVWNPTNDAFVDLDNSGSITGAFEWVLGGHHFVYVSRTEYDQCEVIAQRLNGPGAQVVFREVAWTSFPILPEGTQMLSMAEGLVPTDLSFQLRVQNPYSVSSDQSGENNGYPKYEFTLDGVAPQINNEETAASALDLINVVPNPYYAYSAYELQNTSNVVKITNLPPTCTVTIYSLDGQFIRKYERAENPNAVVPRAGQVAEQMNASIDWDLRNARAIPIASGVYLIHINAPGLGERTIKWFGVQRTFDTYRN